jgi:DegV family protein with EDD domain
MIRIVTDSTSSLPPALISEYGITIVPYAIQFATESYRDGVDITIDQFETKWREAGTMPKTAIPSPGEFIEVYRAVAQPGDSVISIHAGSKISGICGSAQLAAADVPDIAVEVVDSNITSVPLGYMVLEAAKAARAGKAKDEILSIIGKVKDSVAFFATSVELEFIRSSGRIEGAEETADSVLSVKPVIIFDDGTPKVVEKIRRQSAVLNRIVEMAKETAAGRTIRQAAIVHANVEEVALSLKEEVERRLAPESTMVTQLGATLTAHLGPGSLILVPYYSAAS